MKVNIENIGKLVNGDEYVVFYDNGFYYEKVIGVNKSKDFELRVEFITSSARVDHVYLEDFPKICETCEAYKVIKE